MTSNSPALHIGVAQAHQQGEALNCVFGDSMSAEQRAQQIAELTGSGGADHGSLEGLLGAWRGDRLVGAVWAQIQPGCSAAVWPPRLRPGEPRDVADALLQALVRLLTDRGLKVAQALVRPEDPDDFRCFEAAGFGHIADLRYLMSLPRQWPHSEPDSGLTFEPSCAANAERLKQVLQRTFEQTLDCPGLTELRSADDLLAEYRAIGVFDPALWMIVREEQADVGCLLLANHEVPQWELVYIGIVPAVRGRGLGLRIIRHAQWLARTAGRARILLAVDTGNVPAINMYEAAGFEKWEQRSAFLRILTPEPTDGHSQNSQS